MKDCTMRSFKTSFWKNENLKEERCKQSKMIHKRRVSLKECKVVMEKCKVDIEDQRLMREQE